MSRDYPENRTYFTEEEDAMLRTYSDMGYSVAEIAEVLSRPIGSIKTRRRKLGLSKVRGPIGPRTETPEIEQEVFDLIQMRKYVVYFYGACLFAAGLLAFLGDV